MDKYEEGSYDFSNLRHVTGLDHPDNIKRFLQMIPGVTYWTGFGQTEAMSVSACPLDEKPGSAGKPSPLARVALFDDYDNEVPVGTPGDGDETKTTPSPLETDGITPEMSGVLTSRVISGTSKGKPRKNSSNPAEKTSIRLKWRR
ncbi:MAG: AMP-binding protein [Deltaproteobacteria bacterium]|nr:AMP-binding protein [Deltaproteobacteria bacterium]